MSILPSSLENVLCNANELEDSGETQVCAGLTYERFSRRRCLPSQFFSQQQPAFPLRVGSPIDQLSRLYIPELLRAINQKSTVT